MKVINILRDYIYSHDSLILILPLFIGSFAYDKGYFDMIALIIFGLALATVYIFRDRIFGSEFKNKRGIFKPGVDWTAGQNIIRGIILITFIIGFVLPFFLFGSGKMGYETFSDNKELIFITFLFKAICAFTMMIFALAIIINRSNQRGLYLNKLILTEDKVIAFGVKRYMFKYTEANCDKIAKNLISFKNINKSNIILLDLKVFKKKERELIRNIICKMQKIA